MKNLWPQDLESSSINSPLNILNEQAAYLREMTNGKVRVNIDTLGLRDIGTASDKVAKAGFKYGFYLVAPALDNYQYRLFVIAHDIEMYPVYILLSSDLLDQTGLTSDVYRTHEVGSEDEFIESLAIIFSSDKAKRVIGSLIAQSESI